MKLILLTIFAAIMLTSCSEDKSVNTDKDAVKLSFNEVLSYPSFLDFESVYNNYSINRMFVDSIMTSISADDKIYFYLKPDCGCTANYKLFPSIIKTLDSAGFSQENMNYYIMESKENSFPESDIITLTDLPQFFVVNDRGVSNITNTSDTVTIEQVIFNALK